MNRLNFLIGTIVFFYCNLFAQNYVLRFQTPNGFREHDILDENGTLTTDGLDFEGDGILDVIVKGEYPSHSVLVFDGATYQLKWEYSASILGSEMSLYGFFDVDGDSDKEAIFNSYSPNRVIFLNLQTKSIEFTIDSLGLETVLDMDRDGSHELIGKIGDGNSSMVQIWGSGPTGVVAKPNTSSTYYRLFPNYPNPFNPSTTIEYSVQRSGKVQIRIYDTLGQLLRVVVDEVKLIGEYSVSWDGKDDSGRAVATGTYFYQFQIGEFISTKKMLLLR